MKEVIKVSIGRWAFTLESAAYDFLEAYLQQLKQQAAALADENFVQTAENTLGDYLSSQVNNTQQVLSLEQIQQAITACSLPPIDGAAADGKSFAEDFSERLQEKMHQHRLYRHPKHKVLGGVFGGLGAYFSWDPVVFRILYGLFLIIFLFAESNIIFPALLLLYLVLWVAMPLAQNNDELQQLYGGKPVSDDKARQGHLGSRVVDNLAQEAKSSQLGSFLSEFFRITFGIVFFLVGMTGLVILPLCFVWLIPADLMPIINFVPMLPAFGLSRVLFYICLFIPFLIFFYEGIKLLFNLNFKKLRLGLLLFLFWLVSVIVMAVSLFANVGFVGRSGSNMTANYPVEATQDTLYISVDESVFRDDAYVCVLNESLYFLWDNPGDEPTLYSLPTLKIHHDDDADEITVKTEYNSPLAKGNLDFLLNGRSIIEKVNDGFQLYPRVYNKENPWPLHSCKMDIYVPAGMTVIMDYADNSRDGELKPGKRYFIFRGYSYDIDDDLDISTIDGQSISSISFDF